MQFFFAHIHCYFVTLSFHVKDRSSVSLSKRSHRRDDMHVCQRAPMRSAKVRPISIQGPPNLHPVCLIWRLVSSVKAKFR